MTDFQHMCRMLQDATIPHRVVPSTECCGEIHIQHDNDTATVLQFNTVGALCGLECFDLDHVGRIQRPDPYEVRGDYESDG